MNPSTQQGLRRVHNQLQHAGRRLLMIVEGEAEWTLEAVVSILKLLGAEDVLWSSVRAPEQSWVLPAGKANHELGREASHVVYDLYSGLHPDTLAAVAGNIRAGGFLILLCPNLGEWAGFRDPMISRIAVEPWGEASVKTRFLERGAWLLDQYPHKIRYSQVNGLTLCDLPSLANLSRTPDEYGCLTHHQSLAVSAVFRVMTGHRRRPLILEADRGRGKSAAMGIAINILLRAGKQILLTAPRREQVETVLKFASTSTPTGSLQFVAPDRLLECLPSADLLLIDEAAAIAPGLLRKMLRHYSRVVMATTVNGYEGTGRGFAVRFQQHLDRFYPGWVRQIMTEPVRWQPQDWLEDVMDRFLLLRPIAPPQSREAVSEAQISFKQFHYQPETHSEFILNQIFELLVSAHYRTRPVDLRSMLDGSNIRLYLLTQGDQVQAVAMIAQEGELPEHLVDPIFQGRRRPHGQVLPQSLAVHLSHQPALLMTYWRVVRIAVQPHLQGTGLGSKLLQLIAEAAKSEGIDMVGSLFSGDHRVLSFWIANDFAVVRVGYTREATTANHSLLVLQGLSSRGDSLALVGRDQITSDLPQLLVDSHRDLEPSLVLELMRHQQPVVIKFERDQLALERYVSGYTPYENVAASLWRWFWADCDRFSQFLSADEVGTQLLVMKLLQKQSWQVCIEALDLSGNKQARSMLKDTVALCYKQ